VSFKLILRDFFACSGLNFQDLMARQGAIDAPPKTPFILGSECAGEVVQLGAGVENFAVGQRVICLPEFRAWAELVSVPARLAFALPDDMSCEEAAALAMNGLAAHMLLFDVAALSEGQSVLIHSAGGAMVRSAKLLLLLGKLTLT
jgi:NADPH:quinone reductase-like Zn-dependent oxidoreductase